MLNRLKSLRKKNRKGDPLFVIVLAIVTASLAGSLIRNVTILGETQLLACAQCWAIIIANVIAIIGVLWLIQNYRKRRRLEQKEIDYKWEKETSSEEDEHWSED